MPNTNIETKTGEISVYGYMCGYVQLKEVGPTINLKNPFTQKYYDRPRFGVKLYGDCLYHLQVSDWRGEGLEAWVCYGDVREARKAFKRAVKFYSNLPEDYRVERYDPTFDPDWA